MAAYFRPYGPWTIKLENFPLLSAFFSPWSAGTKFAAVAIANGCDDQSTIANSDRAACSADARAAARGGTHTMKACDGKARTTISACSCFPRPGGRRRPRATDATRGKSA